MMTMDDDQVFETKGTTSVEETKKRIDTFVKSIISMKGILVPGLSRGMLDHGIWQRVHKSQTSYLISDPIRIKNILRILNVLIQNIVAGTFISPRELYYKLKGLRHEMSYEHCVSVLILLERILVVPRHCLGILGSSKGLVVGNVTILELYTGSFTLVNDHVTPIPIVAQVPSSFVISTDQNLTQPICILVVEKEAIFNILVQENVHNHLRCIIISGRGMPCMSTRGFLWRLHTDLQIPVYCICDWNAYGFNIFLNYATGGQRMLNPREFAVPTMYHAGIQYKSHIAPLYPTISRYAQPLMGRDIELITGLKARYPAVSEELNKMIALNAKFEIEAVLNLSHTRYSSIVDQIHDWIHHASLYLE